MKILKTAQEVSSRRFARDIANFGCNKCPCCGEMEDVTHIVMTRIEPCGFLGLKENRKTVDHYSCWACGAEWESDTY